MLEGKSMIVNQGPASDTGSRKEEEEDKDENGRKETSLPVDTEETENLVVLGL